MRMRTRGRGALLLAALSLAACSPTPPEAPPAPAMPEHWIVTLDKTYEAETLQTVSQRLGGRVAALRNTTYEVNGRPIKLNTIVAATPADAGAMNATLRKAKPEEWYVRDGTVIYEFVGTDDVRSDMLAGRALLVGRLK